MPTSLPPIPSNAFSGAAVKLSNAPIDRFLMMSQNINMRNQAREYAISKHRDQMNKNVMAAGAGVDANKDESGRSDKDDFMDAVKLWSDHAIANNRKIANPMLDGGEAAAESERRYNEAMDIAQRSKQKLNNIRQVEQKNLEMQQKGYTLPDDVISHIHNAHRRVNDPNYEPIDFGSITYNPKNWGSLEEGRFANEVNKVQAVPQQPIISQDSKSGIQTTTINKKLDDRGRGQLYAIGARYYNSDPSFKRMIDNMVNNPTEESHKYADLYKSEFGVEPTTAEDFSAGYALARNNSTKSDIKTSPIPSYSNIAQQKSIQTAAAKSNITLNKEKNLSDYKKNPPQNAVPDTDAMLRGIEADAVKKKIQPFSNNGKQYAGYSVALTPEIKSVFRRKSGSHNVDVDDVKYNPTNQTYTGIWHAKDEHGVDIGSDLNNVVSKSLPPITLPRATIKDEYDKTHLKKGTVSQGVGGTGGRPPLDSFIRK